MLGRVRTEEPREAGEKQQTEDVEGIRWGRMKGELWCFVALLVGVLAFSASKWFSRFRVLALSGFSRFRGSRAFGVLALSGFSRFRGSALSRFSRFRGSRIFGVLALSGFSRFRGPSKILQNPLK